MSILMSQVKLKLESLKMYNIMIHQKIFFINAAASKSF